MKNLIFFLLAFTTGHSVSQVTSSMIDYHAYQPGVFSAQKCKEYIRVVRECFPGEDASGMGVVIGNLPSGVEAILLWSPDEAEISMSYTLWDPVRRYYRAVNSDGNFVLNQNDLVTQKDTTIYGLFISGEEFLALKEIEDFLTNQGCKIKPTMQDSVLTCITRLNLDGKGEYVYKVKLLDRGLYGLVKIGENYISLEWKEKDKQKTTSFLTVLADGAEWSYFRQEKKRLPGVRGKYKFVSGIQEEPVWHKIVTILQQNGLLCW